MITTLSPTQSSEPKRKDRVGNGQMMKPSARRRARKLALQAIYQWQLAETALGALTEQFLTEVNEKKVDVAYFRGLLIAVIRNVIEIDAKIVPALDRKITELNPIELAVLRLAVGELMYKKDVPYKVVINEALELTKIFGSADGFKYVNAVLDKTAKLMNNE